MKLTIILLVAVILHVSAAASAQKITLTEKNAPLVDVLNHISNQTGYDFLFTGSDLKNAKPISIDVKNVDLSEVLSRIFADQPLTYTIENKSVVISMKETSLFDELTNKLKSALKLSGDISGTVTDTLNNPLVGASVNIKGTPLTAKTDERGNFNFAGLPDGKYTLVVSYVGFEKSEINFSTTGTNMHFGFVLHRSLSQLDAVRVIAYGTDSKRFSVGAINTVNAEDIEKQPVNNPLLALQGQVPGLNVTSTSGIPGSQVLVNVRGQNTLNLNPSLNPTKPYDQPLFIIDGVPFAAQNGNVNQFASLVTAQSINGGLNPGSVGISPFSNIDPADIESISILKDADATSIYGTQGSNGVILITTKKGKAGPTVFDVTVNTSFNSPGRPVQLLNTQQYIQLRNDAFAADGFTPSNNPGNYQSYAPDLTIFDQNKYTNWEKVLYGENTLNTDVHASLSGGTANNTFLIATGYNRSTYNYPGNFADERYTLHSNMRHSSADNKLIVDLTTDFGYGQNNSAGYGGAQDVTLAPNLPDLRDASGNLLWNYKGVDLTSYNFYAGLLQPTDLQNYNLNTALHISYKLLDGLTISANLGYNRNTTDENSINPGTAQNPAYVNRQANFSTNIFQTINLEPQLNYRKYVGKSDFNLLIGSTYKKNTQTSTYLTGQGYSNDNFLQSINGAPSITASDTYNIYKYSAAFARLGYIYNREFIVDLTGRRDGSSNFGPTHQFGNFGSVGAGWIISEEKAVRDLIPSLSYAKLSSSYGTSGSDGIMAYQYQALYASLPTYLPTFQGIRPSSPTNLYNPDYSWALKKSLNVALDLGFFDNRLLLNATYYRDRESNQLVDYPLAVQTGFSAVIGNLDATVQNQGLEFAVNTINIRSRNFSWKTNFNIGMNRNKLIAFPNLANSSYANVYQLGQPTSIVFGYRYKDVNPTTGLFEYYTKTGAASYNPAYGPLSTGGDQVQIANLEIKYAGGFGNTFTYKQFSLYVFCQFANQNAQNYLGQLYTSQIGFNGFNVPTAVLGNYWKTPGDVSQLQRLASSYGTPYIAAAGTSAIGTALRFPQSSGAYGNDIYMRVKTVSLSYQVPTATLNKVHIKGASVFMNAQNLLTFTNYKVGDPEMPGSFSTYPIQRVVAIGLNLKF